MARKQLQRYTDEVHDKFIQNYQVTGRVTKAAKAAGMSLAAIYLLKKTHPTLVEDMEMALEKYRDTLENEARRRGVEGTVKEIYYQGEVVGEERVYSDRMLELLLKKERPHEFRERKEITGAGGGPLEINIMQFDEKAPSPIIDADFTTPKEIKNGSTATTTPSKDDPSVKQRPGTGRITGETLKREDDPTVKQRRTDGSTISEEQPPATRGPSEQAGLPASEPSQQAEVDYANTRRTQTSPSSQEKEEGQEDNQAAPQEEITIEIDPMTKILGKLGLDD